MLLQCDPVGIATKNCPPTGYKSGSLFLIILYYHSSMEANPMGITTLFRAGQTFCK